MSDCGARFIIWSCGTSNTDVRLDFHAGGVKIPSGVKTGTQQGPLSAVDTLETWMTGYSRHAATAVWVGNANNDLVNDRAFASANATVWLWKSWMGAYHEALTARGVTDIAKTFDDIRPKNVALASFSTPATDRTLGGGYCSQTVTAWQRTDVKYESQCESREIDTRNGFLASDQTPPPFRETKMFVKLPGFKADLALILARARGIPIAPTERSTGQLAVAITNLQDGRTVATTLTVTGSVNAPGLRNWTLEIGEGANPGEWKIIGAGNSNVSDGALGVIEPKDLKDNTVYTVRLSTNDGTGLRVSVVINVRKAPVPNNPFGSVTPTPSGTPGASEFPQGTVTPQLPRPGGGN